MSNVKCQKCQNCTFFHYTLYINKIRLGIAPSFSVILRCQVTLEHTRKMHFSLFFLRFRFMKSYLQNGVCNAFENECAYTCTLLWDLNIYFVIVSTPADRAGTESTTSFPSILPVACLSATAFLFSMLFATVSEPGA